MAAEAADTSTEQSLDARKQETTTAALTASIADPAPLGLAAFALTTFVLSVFNAGILGSKLESVVLPLALFYGGLAQVLAGMWEFRKANTFGALAFTSYGAFWLAFAAYVRLIVPGLGADAGSATGLFLLAFAIFTAYMTVAALRVTVAVLLVFIALTLTFVVLSVGNFAGATGIVHVGGYLGLITAILAWYASFAGVTNFTWKRTVVPVGPLS
jgi:succinate-acetate transporter protein